jgi:hypothetical protein
MDLGLSAQAIESVKKLLDLGSTAVSLWEDHLDWHCSRIRLGLLKPSPALPTVAGSLMKLSSGRALELLEYLATKR